jgi:hypothetical protein
VAVEQPPQVDDRLEADEHHRNLRRNLIAWHRPYSFDEGRVLRGVLHKGTLPGQVLTAGYSLYRSHMGYSAGYSPNRWSAAHPPQCTGQRLGVVSPTAKPRAGQTGCGRYSRVAGYFPERTHARTDSAPRWRLRMHTTTHCESMHHSSRLRMPYLRASLL